MTARYTALGGTQASDNCVTQITAGITAVNNKYQTTLSGFQTAQKLAQTAYDAVAKKKPLDREAKDKAKLVLDAAIANTTQTESAMLNEKIEVVSSKIEPLWSQWSGITRNYFPICAFQPDAIPSLLSSIEWIEVRFTKTTCEFMMPKTATNTIALNLEEKTAKEAKKDSKDDDKKDDDKKDDDKKDEFFAAQAIDITPRNVQVNNKGKRKFNGGFAVDGMSLTLENEFSIRNREEEDQVVPDTELELALMDDGTDFSVVPNLSTSFSPPIELRALAKGQFPSQGVCINEYFHASILR